jgi:hypothetical protein
VATDSSSQKRTFKIAPSCKNAHVNDPEVSYLIFLLFVKFASASSKQGTLTEGEASIQLTSLY